MNALTAPHLLSYVALFSFSLLALYMQSSEDRTSACEGALAASIVPGSRPVTQNKNNRIHDTASGYSQGFLRSRNHL